MKIRKFFNLMVFFLLISGLFTALYAENQYPHVANVVAIKGKLMVKHINVPEWLEAYKDMPDYLHDSLQTDSGSVADLQFLSGGHLGINKSTTIEITGPRDVKDVSNKSFVKKIVLKSGEIWAKISKQKEEIEFQTKGGVIAIKGTEFVLEEKESEQKTVLSVLEGKVALKDNSGSEIVYNAGDKITISWQDVPVVKHYENPDSLRKEKEIEFQDMIDAIKTGIQIASSLGAQIPPEVQNTLYAIEVIKDPENAAKDMLQSKINQSIPGPFGIDISSEEKKEPDFPYELSPDQTQINTFTPSFSWKGVPDAVNYWIFISPTEDMKNENLIWNKKINTNNITYPENAKPLQPGAQYFWRLIALNNQDKPVGKASQTYFTVSNNLERKYMLDPQYPVGKGTFYEGSITFYWTKDPSLSNFKLLVADNPNMNNPIISKNSNTGCYTLSESEKGLFKEGSTYYWQVQGLDNNGNNIGQPGKKVQFTLVKQG